MTLITRYVLSQFFRLTLVCQAAALTLFLVAEFIERIDDLIEKNASLRDAVLFFAFKIPQLIVLSIPLTVLLSCTLSLILLSRGNEIIAMRACGASIFRIVTPIFLASLFISGAHFVANEYIVPVTNKRLNHIWYVRIKKYNPAGYDRMKKIWHHSEDNTIWHITHFDPYGDKMRRVTLYLLDASNRLVRRIDAEFAEWVPAEDRWRFRIGLVHDFEAKGEIRQKHFKTAYFPVSDKPEDFKRTGQKPEEMSFLELGEYIETMKLNGVDITAYQVDLWAKLSFPLVSFVLALVGVPFSLKSQRSGGIALGVALTLFIGTTYLVIFYMGLSLGHASRLPPIIAAWGPNALFLTGGTYLLARIRN